MGVSGSEFNSISRSPHLCQSPRSVPSPSGRGSRTLGVSGSEFTRYPGCRTSANHLGQSPLTRGEGADLGAFRDPSSTRYPGCRTSANHLGQSPLPRGTGSRSLGVSASEFNSISRSPHLCQHLGQSLSLWEREPLFGRFGIRVQLDIPVAAPLPITSVSPLSLWERVRVRGFWLGGL